jgi:DNA-binding HxlR family transcriptional regulator
VNEDEVPELCGRGRALVRDVLERVGDKWSVVVLCRLGDSTRRFNELRRLCEPITQRNALDIEKDRETFDAR